MYEEYRKESGGSVNPKYSNASLQFYTKDLKKLKGVSRLC